jgi:hypothetical protein
MLTYIIIETDEEYALVEEYDAFDHSAPIITGSSEDSIINKLEKMLKQVT